MMLCQFLRCFGVFFFFVKCGCALKTAFLNFGGISKITVVGFAFGLLFIECTLGVRNILRVGLACLCRGTYRVVGLVTFTSPVALPTNRTL